MTDSSLPTPDDDSRDNQSLDDQFAPLRETLPPAWVQSANRSVLETADIPTTPWWRRSVVVPVPIALATAASLLATTSATLWPNPSNQDAGGRQAITPNSIAATQSSREVGVDVAKPSPWSVSRTYLESLETIAVPTVPSPIKPEREQDDA